MTVNSSIQTPTLERGSQQYKPSSTTSIYLGSNYAGYWLAGHMVDFESVWVSIPKPTCNELKH